jgi:hypothetical protein
LYTENIIIVLIWWMLAFTAISVIVGLWILVRYLLQRRARRALERQYYRSTHDAEGRLMPPLGRGVCQVCGGVPPQVYYLGDGRRLCPDCLAKEGRRIQGAQAR